MKQPVEFFRWKPFLVMLFLSLGSLAIWGQEEGSEGSSSTTASTNVTVAENAWYTSPWVWLIGVAVFILLLAVILSSQGGGGAVRAPKPEGHQSTAT